MKFYFTYSSSGMAYEGGWTEVEAPSITIAVQAFTAFHRAVNGITACSDIYTESEFRKTGMLAGAAFFGGAALGFQLLVALLHDLAGAKQLAASMIPVLEGWKEENLIYEK